MHRRASFPISRLRCSLLCGLIGCLSLLACSSQAQVRQKQNKQTQPKLMAPVILPLPAPPSAHTETYTDSAGAKHPWTVTSAHALLWDGTPYLPVGGDFTPKSLTDSSDAAWQEDVRALTALHAKGVLDVLISPSKALPDIPVASFQRLLDYLDSNGFRYGLGFGPGITKPLSGYVVKPAHYRYFEADSLSAHWRATQADQGLVTILEDGNSGEYKIVQASHFAIKDDFLSIPLDPTRATGKLIGLLYPHKTLPTGTEGACPDLWSGYDDYRDSLLAYLGHIKFGKGLRFVLDPLARHLGLAGEYDSIVPESEAFRLEWESWLEQRYASLEDARARWAMGENEPKSYNELARYVPLWLGDRGLGYLFDPQDDHIMRVDSTKSAFWNDFREFRTMSISNYMHTLAETLKHQVADVPVVYTWTQSHPIFLNAEAEGFDGLALATHGKPSIAGQLGPALSQTEQAVRPIWFLATEISPNLPAPAAVSPDPPAGSASTAARIALFSTLDEMKKTGIKGFFTGSTALDAGPTNAAWLSAPDRVDWLHDYAAQLAAQPNAARDLPRVLFYPQNAPGPAHTGPVPNAPNVLWLPADADGETLDYWPSFSGYILRADADHQVTVMVSLKGHRTVHFILPDNSQVTAFTVDGVPVPIKKIEKSEFTIALESTPTIIHAGPQQLILQEASEDALAQLETLFAKTANSKSPEVVNVKSSLGNAEDFMIRKNYPDAYTFARDGLNSMIDILQPYIWVEGESIGSKGNTFDEVAAHPEASGGRYLRLSNPNPPSSKYGYGAHWEFDVHEDGRYNVWMACSVPGPSISPIRWAVDAKPNMDPVDLKPHGPLYAGDQFGWILLGAVTIKKGEHGERHALEIEVIDHAVSPQIYNFAVDAFVLSKSTFPFTPNAAVWPVPVENAVLQPQSNIKKKLK